MLRPGEDSIGSCAITTDEERGLKYLRWSIRLPDGRLLTRRTQAPAGTTDGALRRRARDKARTLIAEAGVSGSWKLTSSLTDYITQVSIPAVETARLRDASKARYTQLLTDVMSTRYLGSHTIADGTRFRALERVITDFAADRGRESGRQLRNVLSKYVCEQVIRDGLLDHHPLRGMSIDLGEVKTRRRADGGQAVTRAEYDRILDYLLAQRPGETDGLTLARSIAKRRTAIDLTLLQMTTGLRISEARQITWSRHVHVDTDGTVRITVTEDISKTKRARTIPILDDAAGRVTAHLLARRDEIGGKYVIGAPVNPDTVWDRKNASDAVESLYLELAEKCDVPLLGPGGARSHVWRATLNSMLLDLPEAARSAYFGHDSSVNRKAYTDLTDLTPLVEAAKTRRHLRAV